MLGMTEIDEKQPIKTKDGKFTIKAWNETYNQFKENDTSKVKKCFEFSCPVTLHMHYLIFIFRHLCAD